MWLTFFFAPMRALVISLDLEGENLQSVEKERTKIWARIGLKASTKLSSN